VSLHILVLAAGEGSRFGGAVKQLAMIGDKTMLEHALDTASTLAPYSVSVVLGCRHQQLSLLVGETQVIINPHWKDGLGSSIACGVAALPASASAVLIMLGDQPALSNMDLAGLTACYEQVCNNAVPPIVCASYADGLGVPAIFPKHFFKQLMALKGDVGAKPLLHQNPVMAVPLPAAAIDIDTQEQLAQWNFPDS
jgi:molybdenum cofactor cytidylyltransferase